MKINVLDWKINTQYINICQFVHCKQPISDREEKATEVYSNQGSHFRKEDIERGWRGEEEIEMR